MKLHEDRNAFKVLLSNIHERTGYREDVLEKDYYVMLILEELSEKQQQGLPAYFKGGTALYKALKTTNRFSEDIDISVDTRECSRTQSDKRLEQSAKKYVSLRRNIDESISHRSEVIVVYEYEPVSVFDADDALQRFGKVKVESTSFTISEPVSDLEVSYMIYDLATEQEKTILTDVFGIKPFIVKTITIERIFVDKLFATEAYVLRSDIPHRAFEAAKHIYDLAFMVNQESIIKLLSTNELLKRLLSIRIAEERNRLDGIPDVLPKDFTFFESVTHNSAVKDAYRIMQNQYVLRDVDRIEFDAAISKINQIRILLEENIAWKECGL